jgi:D-sedoheptulose 7-phosphate isomerase
MNNIDNFFLDSNGIGEFSIHYFNYLNKVLSRIDKKSITQLADLLLDARDKGKTIFFIGNGGSASTASHFCNDLSIGTQSYKKPFKAISLTDNNSILTALGNDYGYDQIFVKQLIVQAGEGDLLIGISASGNSKNIINSFEYARNNNIKEFAITGFDGGMLKSMSKYGIHVATEKNEYGIAEDTHLIIDHLVTSYIRMLLKDE